MPADKRVTRGVFAAFIALAAAFIVTSVVEVASVLFFSDVDPRPKVSAGCDDGIRALAAAVDRAAASAAAAPPQDAKARYSEAKNPEWGDGKDALVRPCTNDPHGPAALAAVARLDRAAEAWIQRRGAELSPVRREVDSFIR